MKFPNSRYQRHHKTVNLSSAVFTSTAPLPVRLHRAHVNDKGCEEEAIIAKWFRHVCFQVTFLLAWPSLPLKPSNVQLDFLAIYEIITDNLENDVALENFSFNKHFALFPRVNKTVAFDIHPFQKTLSERTANGSCRTEIARPKGTVVSILMSSSRGAKLGSLSNQDDDSYTNATNLHI